MRIRLRPVNGTVAPVKAGLEGSVRQMAGIDLGPGLSNGHHSVPIRTHWTRVLDGPALGA